MSSRYVRVRDFIQGKNTPNLSDLPLVHTTHTQYFFDIVDEMKLKPTPCNTFVGENLLYCFVGRPAYKWQTESKARLWQLPSVFIFDRPQETQWKRAIPFDSGSFAGRLPDYINSFPLENFYLDTSQQAIARFISVFYKGNREYFRGEPLGEQEFNREHMLMPRHQEILALIGLFNERDMSKADDRKSAIELQTEDAIDLDREHLLGAVLPSDLKRETADINRLRAMGIDVRFYAEYPIRVQDYTFAIYDAVADILSNVGRL